MRRSIEIDIVRDERAGGEPLDDRMPQIDRVQ